MNGLKFVAKASQHGSSVAYRSGSADRSYAELIDRSARIAAALLGSENDLKEARIALLAPAGFDYTSMQWAIWRAGGVVVPLCLSAAEPELDYALSDSQSQAAISTRELAEKVRPLCQRLGISLRILEEIDEAEPAETSLPEVSPERRGMILYTSGTTSKPKGVVSTHANIQAQIETLVEAWQWQSDDRIPLFLPLHHIHGIININACALWVGAMIEAFPTFDIGTICDRVRAEAYSVFMAVPTIYVKLIEALEAMPEDVRSATIAGFAKMRLMISGSAALPASVHETWTALTGQKLLERYGMTEIGMALSNPFHGERRPGAVGQPLPGVDVRLVAEDAQLVTEEGEPGEIQVRGPAVFSEYWSKAEATAESFTDDGWFRTGDMAVVETGYYRIMGRLSVDIIKSGGYKLSALEIEATLLQHPAIRECAVIGLPDDTWGEMVAVAAVLEAEAELDIEALRDWCREHQSAYKIPKRLLVVDALPSNAMGKVTKPSVSDMFG